MSEKTIRWTADQEAALDARNVGLAVSAAAGSGKTAVLTERIVRLLSAPAPHTLDVARLCVVTFTKAAAGELEAKLYEALTAAVAKRPGDRRLASQLFRLDQAHISTIDSFCLDLIRAYRRELDLRPGVRVCEETEEDLLFREAEEEGMDLYFAGEEKTEEKDRFYALFCTAKNRDGLLAVLKTMKQKADNCAEGTDFFRTRLAALAEETQRVRSGALAFYESSAGRLLAESARETVVRIREATEHLGRDVMEHHPLFAEKRGEFFLSRRPLLENVLAALDGGELFRAGRLLEEFCAVRIPAIRGLTEEEKAEKEPYDAAWKGYKSELKALSDGALSVPWEERQADMEEFLPLANALVGLFETTLTRFTEKKRERNVLSFSDLASLTLRLVGQREGGVFVPTAAGREIGERFSAVFVDEYQDTNSIQDAIFRCITGGRNLFLVGDPKQCVYHFRGAEPEVFIRYRKTLPDYKAGEDQVMARHFLSDNFRCDRPVIDFTNALFRVLMNGEDPESLYRPSDELRPGKEISAYREMPVEVCVLEPKPSEKGEGGAGSEQKEEEETENREAAYIADRIRAVLDGEIKRADGTPYQPEDIAVIARTWKNVEKVQGALSRRGIPAAWSKGEEGESSPEEFFVASLLKAADNPTRDVPLLAALYSPVFRFSPDDLFRLRKDHPGVSFFAALTAEAASESAAAPACRAALDALSALRRDARVMTPTELIFTVYRSFNVEELYRKTSPGGGAVRKKFLRLARQAETAGFTTLARFCQYLSSVQEKSDNAAGAGVRLMTIHKAKGLEFPVVFVSFLSARKGGNTGGRVWMSARYGAAFPLPKWGGVSNRDHLLTDLARREEAAEERAEELRVLYVALTRAKDKLILTGAPKSLAALQSRTLFHCSAPLTPALAQGLLGAASTPLEFLFVGLHDSPALRKALQSGAGEEKGLFASLIPYAPPVCDGEERGASAPASPGTPLPPWEKVLPYLNFTYAHPERETLPKKLSVSEIVRQGRQEEAQLVPRGLSDFERGVLKADAAFRGTAIHQAMQFADLERASRSPDGELDRLLREGFLTEKMAREIDRQAFAAFFRSDLYRRIAASPRVVHEKRFNVLLSGEELVGRPGEILIQGVVDLWFEKEDGTIALLDFKTDRLPPDGDAILRERHGEQLRIYRRAVEAMEEKPVTELLLYSFSLSRAVPVPLNG